MPGAGDPGNVTPNLETLASLTFRSDGAKLSYSTQTGLFSVQGVGFKQKVVRTFTKESVLDATRFREPLLELFEAAAELTEIDDEAVVLFEDARDGLHSLRATYSGDAQKLSVVQGVIDEINRWDEPEFRDAIDLREKYRRYLECAFSQDILLTRDAGGVCYGFICDWARRILTSRKFSYAAKTKGRAAELSVRPRVGERKRMMKKVDRRIQPLHEELNRIQDEYFDKGKNISQAEAFNLLVDDETEFYNKKFNKFQDISIHECVVYRHINKYDDGVDVFREIFRETDRYKDGPWVFKVGVRRSDRSGHAIGIDLYEGQLQFIDPNVGEFCFPKGAEEVGDDFLDDWWRMFCMTRTRRGSRKQKYESWNLEILFRR